MTNPEFSGYQVKNIHFTHGYNSNEGWEPFVKPNLRTLNYGPFSTLVFAERKIGNATGLRWLASVDSLNTCSADHSTWDDLHYKRRAAVHNHESRQAQLTDCSRKG